jgi:hypothetical protein
MNEEDIPNFKIIYFQEHSFYQLNHMWLVAWLYCRSFAQRGFPQIPSIAHPLCHLFDRMGELPPSEPPHSPPIKDSTMSELRQRQPATSAGSSQNAESAPQRRQERRADAEESHGISTLDIIRIIATLILASCGLSYYITNSESLLWGYRPWFTRWPVVKTYLVSLSLSLSRLIAGAHPPISKGTSPHTQGNY